jgi:hypothetical protein
VFGGKSPETVVFLLADCIGNVDAVC